MKTRRFRSFAKINLGLEVVGRLPNGYHELNTLFATLSLHDVIEVAEAKKGVSIRCDRPDVPNDETNLAHRAAVLMQQISGRSDGVAIRIRKRIAAGGGLGGGSSNAATVLRALDLIWGLGLAPAGLIEAAKSLGADVPYFLFGGPALGRGRGDDIRTLDLPLRERILLVPGRGGLSTAAVFKRFASRGGVSGKGSPIDAVVRAIDRQKADQVPRLMNALRNDLEGDAMALSEAVANTSRRVRTVARSAGALRSGMSGSGSSFFLLFDEASKQRAAALALRGLGIPSRRCAFVSNRAYQSRFEIKT